LRQRKSLRGTSDVAFFIYSDKIPQLPKIHK
jgi:hypothetical protein